MMRPGAARTVMVPPVSLLRHLVPPGTGHWLTVLRWKLVDNAYQRRSPSASRRSGRPSVLKGNRPIRLLADEQVSSAWPSLFRAEQGRSPGRVPSESELTATA